MMSLWFGIVLMTAAAVAAVLWPLRLRPAQARSGSRFEVCRILLADIARDRAAGLIAKADADAAFVEASRRLLAAAQREPMPGAAVASADWRRRLVAAAIPILLPLGAGGLYVAFGSPGLPAQPLAARLEGGVQTGSSPAPAAEADNGTNRQRTRASPGWQFVPRVGLRLGPLEDAVARVRDPNADGPTPSEATAGRLDSDIAFDASGPGASLLVELVTEPGRDRPGAIWGHILNVLQSGAPSRARVGQPRSPLSADRTLRPQTSNTRLGSRGAVGDLTDPQ